jgi:hypothetical protein
MFWITALAFLVAAALVKLGVDLLLVRLLSVALLSYLPVRKSSAALSRFTFTGSGGA